MAQTLVLAETLLIPPPTFHLFEPSAMSSIPFLESWGSSSGSSTSHSLSSSPPTSPALSVDKTLILPSPLLPNVPPPDLADVVDAADANTPDKWVKRDSRLIRLTGKHPFNCEPQLDDLYAAGFLTPTSLFYVRNHGAVPRIPMYTSSSSQGQPVALHAHSTWQVRIHGLVSKECVFTVNDLKRRFKVVTLPVTLVCAGNRRREQNVVSKSLGFSWGAAGLSTALFTGVYLSDVLAYAQPDVAAKRTGHCIFEGSDDDLPNGPYGTSQTMKWAMSKDKGMLIAWKMNGLDLEADHGFPVRVVIPGQIGGRSVKWLRRIEVSMQESQHHVREQALKRL